MTPKVRQSYQEKNIQGDRKKFWSLLLCSSVSVFDRRKSIKLKLDSVFVRIGFRKKVESTQKKSRHLGKYDIPKEIGEKQQLDVKYVPAACYPGNDDEKFFQYTVIKEASSKRFIYSVPLVLHLLSHYKYCRNLRKKYLQNVIFML